MAYEVIQINEHSWRIENEGVRCFLLEGTERALLVDTGMVPGKLRALAEGLTDRPVSLLNTHADRDHVGCNDQFDVCWLHPAEEPAYRRQFPEGKTLPLADGQLLDLGGRVLEVLHIPGHTPGSVALLDRAGRVLLSGDTVQDGSIFMFGPGRDMEAYLRSLELLEQRKGEFDEIWPSHATIPVSPELIARLLAGARDIQAGKLLGVPGEMFGFSILAYDPGCAKFLCDRKE